MRISIVFPALLATLLTITGATLAVPPTPGVPKGYVCTRAENPIRVDGRLDQAEWARVPWTDDFVDIEGDLKPRPRFRTRAKMLWDDDYFYVAAEITEPHVWGTLKQHDSVIFHDNDFEVFIDPDGDNHEYYEFEMNALNTGWDLFLGKPYRDGGPARNEWEIPGLKTGVHVNGSLNDASDEDRSWTVEIAFPWKVLSEFAHRPAPPRPGDQWRVNFSRVEWKHVLEGGTYKKVPNTREDNWVWSPQGVIDMHRPELWGYVQFSTRPPGVDVFRRDPAEGVRAGLMAVYHAQRAYRERTKSWADSIEALGLKDLPRIAGASQPRLVRDGAAYRAEIDMEAQRDRPAEVWSIASDSRITHRPAR